MIPRTIPRVALVTGAARRLGRAMALGLAAEGFDVAIHCRAADAEAEATLGEVRALGCRGTVVAADLAREEEAARVVPEAADALGPLGVLVNNAALFELDRLGTAHRDSWERHMAVNLRAPVVLAQGFVARLPQGAEGLIVNLVDQRVRNLTPNYLSYSVSKVGLWAVTQLLARELAPAVRVNAIAPGIVFPAPGTSEARLQELRRSTPLRRGTAPEEIVAALRFILAAPSMTGQLVTLDGGMQLGWLTPGAPPEP
jgi:NAD(P)-dependent dehydrogenase (short-subunit alcohol dehydrogenase family)